MEIVNKALSKLGLESPHYMIIFKKLTNQNALASGLKVISNIEKNVTYFQSRNPYTH